MKRGLIHNFRLILLMLLIIHWIIPIELPFLGSRSGSIINGVLFFLLFVSLFLNVNKFLLSQKLFLFFSCYLLFFILRIVSPLCWDNTFEWKLSYLWFPLSVFLLMTVSSSFDDIKLGFVVLLSAIAASIIYGILMVHVGEPFVSLRNVLITIGDVGEDRMALHEFRNVGFASSIFAMGYQIAVVFCAVLLAFLVSKKTINKLLLIVALLIFVVGIVDNAERASIVGIVAGLLVCVYRLHLMRVKSFISVFFLAVAVYSLFASGIISPQGDERHGNLLMRIQDVQLEEDNLVRIERQFIGFVSMFSFSESPRNKYKRLCDKMIGDSNVAPHNHYISVGLDGCWLFFMELFLLAAIYDIYKVGCKKLRKKFRKEYVLHVVIFSALIAEMTTALFHNNGIFSTEPAGIILLGLLCASTHNAFRLKKRVVIVNHEKD